MQTKNLHLMYAYPVKAGVHEFTTDGIEIDLPKGITLDDVIGIFPYNGIIFEKTSTKMKGTALKDTVSTTDADTLIYILSRDFYEA